MDIRASGGNYQFYLSAEEIIKMRTQDLETVLEDAHGLLKKVCLHLHYGPTENPGVIEVNDNGKLLITIDQVAYMGLQAFHDWISYVGDNTVKLLKSHS